MSKLKIFFLLPFVVLSFLSFSQKEGKRISNKKRRGVGISYYDSANTKVYSTGKFRRGNEIGLWKFFDPDGHLEKKQRIIFNRYFTKYYYPNGKLHEKGQARIVYSDTVDHFYFYGKWKTYNLNGELIKEAIYNNGVLISEKYIHPLNNTSLKDTLIDVLRKLEKQLFIYSDSLQTVKKDFGEASEKFKRLLIFSNLNALHVYDDIDKIILKYGYPGKSLVGEEYAIAFSMISSGDLSIKERFYDIIVSAANVGELEWKDVACFVDKVKIARKEKQIYGTQYRYFTGGKIVYFPIENKITLNERRRKVGLDDYDINKIDDTAGY